MKAQFLTWATVLKAMKVNQICHFCQIQINLKITMPTGTSCQMSMKRFANVFYCLLSGQFFFLFFLGLNFICLLPLSLWAMVVAVRASVCWVDGDFVCELYSLFFICFFYSRAVIVEPPLLTNLTRELTSRRNT